MYIYIYRVIDITRSGNKVDKNSCLDSDVYKMEGGKNGNNWFDRLINESEDTGFNRVI